MGLRFRGSDCRVEVRIRRTADADKNDFIIEEIECRLREVSHIP
jgi:hypothetical protein